MSWQWADEPSHIAPETGPNLLTGSGPWTVALTPGVEYALTVDVLGDGDTLVEWQVSVTDGETGDLDYPTISETVPGGDWVTVTLPLTAPAFDATATVTLSTPGQSRAPSLAALTGRTILTVPGDVLAETIMASGGIVAGTPGGARVELTDEGLAAFDTDGTETAQIRGEGGEFVGGEFRTSDTLPGQVTLSDTGFEDPLASGIPGPGVGVTPRNPDGFTRFPGVGPSWGGMTVSGGRDTTGRWATVEASPTSSTLRAVDEGGGGSGYISTAAGESRVLASGPDGESGEVRSTPTASRLQTRTAGGTLASEVNASPTAVTARTYGASGESGWMRARPGDVELAYVDSLNTYFSRIRTTETEASLFTRAGGTNRYMVVDADGIWVKSGSTAYNLLETAQDSGWQAITPATGYQNASGGAPFEYRRMGRMIHLRGRVSATSGVLTAGTAHTIGTLPAGVRPAHTHRTIIAGGSASSWGRIDVSGGTGALTVAPISANMNWVDLAGTMWTVD